MSSTSQPHVVGARAKRLDDDFRVGSYVVHTPPARYNTEATAAALATRSNATSNHNISQIPGYQFKTKIATIGPYQSPPLSPKRKCSPSKPDILSPFRNGLSLFETKQSEDTAETSSSLSPYLLSHHQQQQPRAIPRSVLGLKQQLVDNQTQQEPEPTMGDRLSSPVVATSGERHFISNNKARVLSQRGHIKKPIEHTPPQQQQHLQRDIDGIGNHKQTPRLPRGVSRIPHQVYSSEKSSSANGSNIVQHYQQQESVGDNRGIESEISISNSSRYLTFSKDQATSHFKTLKDELSGHESPIAVTNKPSPLERQSKSRTPAIVSFAIKSNEINTSNKVEAFSNNNTQLRQQQHQHNHNHQQQQPICEAFIMTGQSMLKLSCNESENTNNGNNINSSGGSSNNNHNSNSASREVESRMKSLSLNKLNKNTTRANHLKSSEEIGRCRVNNNDSTTTSSGENFSSNVDRLFEKTRTKTITKREGDDDSEFVTSSTTVSSSPVQRQFEPIELLSKRVDPTDNRCSSTNSVRGQNNNINNRNNKNSENITGSASPLVIVSSNIQYSENNRNDHQAANVTQAVAEPDAKLERIETAAEVYEERNPNESCVNFCNSKNNINSSPSCDYQAERCQVSQFQITQQTSSKPLSSNETINKNNKLDAPNKTSPPIAGDNATLQDEPDKAVILNLTRANSQDIISSEKGSPTTTERFSHDITSQANLVRPSTPTNTDRESARRLAKRLYSLSGFKKADVCHHLAKMNPFSQLVAEEYLNLFDFRSTKLDAALRKFLAKLQLNGETQERERVLSVFSQRYYDCNKDKFPSSGIVQTLVCALILLNTDLHGGHTTKKQSKLSLGAFVDGLNNSLAATSDRPGDNLTGSIGACLNGADLNYTFPRHLLVDLYESIRKRPLKYSEGKCDINSFEAELDRMYAQQVGNRGNRSNTLPTRRFAPGSNAPSSTMSATSRRLLKQGLNKLNIQDESEAAIEFKSGYLNRKRIFDANGSATSKGRRSWRRVYVILQDLRLIMRFKLQDNTKNQPNDKITAKHRAQTVAQDMKNTLKIHHAFAKRSTSYIKRDFVFHLRFADESEILLEAGSEEEASSWIDTINFAAACLSSPALPSAVSNSNGKIVPHKTRKPVLPAAYTKLSYWEQLIDHEERLQKLKVELDEHLSEAPNTKNANKRYKTEFIDKIAYMKQEIERHTVYVDLMRKRSNSPEAIILSKHPQIASLVPSKEMILSLPSFAPPNTVASLTDTSHTNSQAIC